MKRIFLPEIKLASEVVCLSVAKFRISCYINFLFFLTALLYKGKGEGKFHLRTGHEGPEEGRGIALLFP